MTVATLTSRERVTRALERRDHDRVPRFDSLWDETLVRFRKEGMVGELADLFHFDVANISKFGPFPFPGRREVLREDAHTIDVVNAYGARHREWKDRSGVPEHLGNECDNVDAWRKRFKRAVANPTIDLEEAKKHFRVGRDAGRWICIGVRGVFSFTQTLVGDETLLMAMALEPDWTTEMFQTVTDAYILYAKRALEAGLDYDGIWMADDQAYRNGPFYSPAMYRQQIWPGHQRMAQFCHENGLKFILHTDGDIRTLIDHMLDAKVDALQPLEAKAGLDVRELAPRIGNRVSLWGNIDMTVALTNDRARIEHEVVSKLRAGMATKGYLYHSDHSVPPQVSYATYRYIHELLDQHGAYA